MKPVTAAKMFVIVSGSLLLAAGAAAQSTDGTATPAVQKVAVKGVARFDFDKATVNSEDGAKLMSEVRSMKNVTWNTINVTGHTDSIGSETYNQKLSEDRAQAVQAYLVEKGVKSEKIKSAGKGKTSPIASNKTPTGRSLNRRTEIEFQGVQSLAQR
jgi:OOP family OmpA-OmpF porin